MRKRQGAGYYFPGKDFDSLRTALKRAFGDVTDGDVTDPDRNCYIEVEVKKDRDVAGQWLTEYEDKVENLHNYALNKTNYHLDRRGKHPVYSAQLTGVRDVAGRLPDEMGVTEPFPHSWIPQRAFENVKLQVTTPFADVFPYLEEGMNFKLHVKVGNVVHEFAFRLRNVDGEPGISPDDLAAILNRPRNKPYRVRLLEKRFWIHEGGKPPERVTWGRVLIETNGEVHFTAENAPTQAALKKLGFPVRSFVGVKGWQTIVAVHEIGHDFYNGGTIGRSEHNERKLGKWYHEAHCSYRLASLSGTGGFCGLYFSPLIAREYRCSVFAYFSPAGAGFGD